MIVLDGRGLVSRRGPRTVLNGIDVAFSAGELVAIVGPNGGGKTTLLRHLAGLDVPAEGHVWLTGRKLLSLTAAERALRIAYLPQAASVYWPMQGRDLVALGRLPHGANLSLPLKPVDDEAVRRALDRVDGDTLDGRAVDTLSHGERSRLMLARALATEAPVILADEPVASLDPAYSLDAMAILRAEAARGVCVVVVLHDLGLAARFADRVVVLNDARIASDGPPGEALVPSVIDQVYGVGFRHVEIEGITQPIAWEHSRRREGRRGRG